MGIIPFLLNLRRARMLMDQRKQQQAKEKEEKSYSMSPEEFARAISYSLRTPSLPSDSNR